jgi:hypothetical protein
MKTEDSRKETNQKWKEEFIAEDKHGLRINAAVKFILCNSN